MATTYSYTSQAKENEAKAVGVSMPVSYKQSYEVAKFIRGKNVQLAKKMLEDVIDMKRPVPMTRFNRDTGHKHGMAAGRFTVNTCTFILKLLKSAESNAQFKGLSTANLIVRHIAAQKGPTSFRYGRHRRRQAKRAHVEIIVAEQKESSEKPARASASADQQTKSALPARQKQAKKTETKPALPAQAAEPKTAAPKATPVESKPAKTVQKEVKK
jgi:large subunit ribosomal protein L22